MAQGLGTDSSDPEQVRRHVRRWLWGVPWSFVIIPLIFWVRYRQVGPLGWGLSVFFATYCVLAAVGLHFLVRPEYHTPVRFKGDWVDRVGMFWLVVCGLGTFLGWVLTVDLFVTDTNWRWLYGGRVFLCMVVPVLTALCLTRYVRGLGAPVMLALLVGVTALPVWSAWGTLQALLEK